MAQLHPFLGWTPDPSRVQEIACVPYDVINTEEARELDRRNPGSFLRVVRPEITCSDDVDIHDDEVYQAGAKEWAELKAGGAFRQAEQPSLYVYQLEMDGRTQTGLFGCVSVEDYDRDVILKHELTRPDKEEDRTRHILTQSAHAEPVMLTFRDRGNVAASMAREMAAAPPHFDFMAEDGVAHRVWVVKNPAEYVSAFADIPHLFVADGHHRCKSASNAVARLRAEGKPVGEAAWFPAVLFPMADMRILAYNRAVAQASPDAIKRFVETVSPEPADDSVPAKRGEACAYFNGEWSRFELPSPSRPDAVSSLDASRLQEGVLTPCFGIGDPRTDPSIFFVGGIRGTGELERLVDSGRAAITFSMHPTSIEELVDVSEAGLLMPPKSTWFEPKLRSGLIVHDF